MKLPLITVITAVYNGERYLEETILSVLNQTYQNIEYIIIDGGSEDKTLDIIKKYENKIAYWISEKDDGISDAFNKGINVSNGVYINFQGDGDGFIEDDSIEKLFHNINPEVDVFVSGRIKRIDVNGNKMFISKHVDKFYPESLLKRMSLPHQGLFTHKKYFETYGLFDVNNKYCMDYEHLLRSYHNFPKVVTKNIVVANWRDDGLGNGRIPEVLEEYNVIRKHHKISNNVFLELIHYWSLLKFYIKSLIRKS